MKNKYPIFVPTKGRFRTPYTIEALKEINADFSIVVERQELEDYRTLVPREKILVLPHSNEGLVKTRNWIWDYAANELKTPYFWTFDDNIRGVWRLHNNRKIRIRTTTPLAVIENFSERYENLAICGMNYFMFASRKTELPAITFNTRIYSNMLIKTTIPFRNELFFNDDTDLCLRVLKAGLCTVQFNAFLVYKLPTMTVKGGMTDFYEKTNKRLEFAEMLARAHPDCVRVTKKFGRYHHQVDYRRFKRNKLIRKRGYEIKNGVNDYGLRLVELSERS